MAPATAPVMAPAWVFWFEPSVAQPELRMEVSNRAELVLKMTRGRYDFMNAGDTF
jgi:hypothetical protein